jgi:FlaA1/EpsC-like NDP-sugar epimerase
MRKRNVVKLTFLLVGDVVSIVSGFYIAFAIRIGKDSGEFLPLYIKSFSLLTLLFLIAFALKGLYTKKYLYYLDEVLNVFISFILVLLLFMAFAFVYKIGSKYSRFVLGIGSSFSFILDIIVRYAIKSLLSRTGVLKTNVLIIGNGEIANLLIATLKKTD